MNPLEVDWIKSVVRSPTTELRVAYRAVWLWLTVRLVAAVLHQLAAAFLPASLRFAGENPVSLHPRAALIVVVVVGTLSFLDVRRQHQDVFLANLGTPAAVVLLLGFMPAVMMEVLVAMLLRM